MHKIINNEIITSGIESNIYCLNTSKITGVIIITNSGNGNIDDESYDEINIKLEIDTLNQTTSGNYGGIKSKN